jgi:transposase
VNDTGNKTREYEKYCLKFLINSTIKDVSEKLNTTEEVIEGIINRNVKTNINWMEANPTIMGIDEIALRKGHFHYLTIVSDLSDNKKVKILGVLDGNSKDDILPFLQSIPKEILLSLESVTIDMGASYFSALKELIDDVDRFNRIVIIDRFHVAKLLGDKVDKERKKVVKKLKIEFENDDDKLESIKRTMWPFRHHRDDLSEDANDRLEKLFELAPSLKECYKLREELYKIFEIEGLSKEEAKEEIDE